MASAEHSKPLIGGLTFFGAAAFQIAMALVLGALSQNAGNDRVSQWIGTHLWLSVGALLLVSSAVTSATLWFVSRRKYTSLPDVELIDAATAQLAEALRQELENDPQTVALDRPHGITVRWHNADEELMDRWCDIRLDPAVDTPLQLAGAGDDIWQVFQSVPSGRLVVLGKAGAGKSLLMTRFIRRSLQQRADASSPVPILAALATWNPKTTALRDWLTSELADQQPSLAQRSADGRLLARILIDAGRLMYVLDGLDEMPATLRTEALHMLSTSLRRTDRVIVTSRVAEYRAAVSATEPLAESAAIVLEDLRPSDIQSYLPSTTGDARRGSRWSPVLATLATAEAQTPAAALRDVLRTPLMVNLARISYQDARTRPEDLLAATSVERMEEMLLDRYLVAAMDAPPGRRQRQHRSSARTEKYLAGIAGYMVSQKTPYFRWWELADSLTLRARVAVGVGFGIVTTLVLTTASVVSAAASGLTAENIGISVLDPFVSGPVVALGIAIGFVVGRHLDGKRVSRAGIQLVPARIRRTWRRRVAAGTVGRGGARTFVLAFRLGLVAAIAAAAVVVGLIMGDALINDSGGLTYLLIGVLFAILYAVGCLLIFTCAVWSALQVGQWLEEPIDLTEVWSPLALVRSNRRTVILESLLGGLATAAICVLAIIPAYFLISLGDLVEGDPVAYGLEDLRELVAWALTIAPGVAALTITTVLFTVTAWGRFVLARVYYAATGRLPLRLMGFLTEVHQLGIMRQTGPAFQFRHLKVRDRVAQRIDAAA